MTGPEERALQEIFRAFAVTGAPPPVCDDAAVASLAAQCLVVTEPGTGKILMAPPFAAHRSGTTEVRSGVRRWWSTCPWCGLGIVAALGLHEAVLRTDGVEIRVRNGTVVDDGLLLHVAVPAAAWWEDLPFACATTKVFRSEDEIEEWCRLNEVQRGAVVGLDQVERHAALWYADRIDPQWRRPGPGEAQRRLEAAGMTGPFWRLTAPAPA
jgi:hypothetical protein